FSYFFIWTVNPQLWRQAPLPALPWPGLALLLYVASSTAIWGAGRCIDSSGDGVRGRLFPLLMGTAPLLLAAGLGAETYGEWQAGLRPTDTAYAALVYTFAALQGQFV